MFALSISLPLNWNIPCLPGWSFGICFTNWSTFPESKHHGVETVFPADI